MSLLYWKSTAQHILETTESPTWIWGNSSRHYSSVSPITRAARACQKFVNCGL